VLRALGHPVDWPRAGRTYRKYLFLMGQTRGVDAMGKPLRPGFTLEQVQQVLAQGGVLPRAEALRCRIRYFTDGVVLGSKAFVEDIFHKNRRRLNRKRGPAAYPR